MSKYKSVSVGEAWSLKYPEQVVMVTSVNSNGIPNTMPAGWCMPSSGKPPMLAVSIGKERYTSENIKDSNEFVISFPNENTVEKLVFCGKKSGRDMKKLDRCNWETQSAKLVKPPLLANCTVHFECRVSSVTLSGDHLIFLGEIIASHVAEDKTGRIYNFGQGKFSTIPGF